MLYLLGLMISLLEGVHCTRHLLGESNEALARAIRDLYRHQLVRVHESDTDGHTIAHLDPLSSVAVIWKLHREMPKSTYSSPGC